MYRRQPGTLPPDPKWNANLEQLGFFINDEGKIRNVEHLTDPYLHRISTSERYNSIYREAMRECIRNEILDRLEAEGLQTIYCPSLSSEKTDAPEVPILITPREQMRHKSQIILLINKSSQDMGVLSYPLLEQNGGITKGSVLEFLGACKSADWSTAPVSSGSLHSNVPGFVILNPGQLRYTWTTPTSATHPCPRGRAVSATTWQALPRPSLAHPSRRLDFEWNQVPDNTTAAEHIAFVFDKVIGNPDFVSASAKLFIVAMEDSADKLMNNFLRENWWSDARTDYNQRIVALAAVGIAPTFRTDTGLHVTNRDAKHAEYFAFLRNKVRAFQLSGLPVGEPMAGAHDLPLMKNERGCIYQDHETHCAGESGVLSTRLDENDMEALLCPHFSGGHGKSFELLFPTSHPDILAWFLQVNRAETGPNKNAQNSNAKEKPPP